MKQLLHSVPQEVWMPNEDQVVELCLAADALENSYATGAVIAGLALFEYRAFMGNSHLNGRVSHSGKPSVNGRNQHSEGDGFLAWLAKKGISKTKAYRWMNAAEAVARQLQGVAAGDPWSPVIDVDGEVISLSQALSAPEGELPKAALDFRQSLFDFMEDKTIAEAIGAAVDGLSEAHRITRAANGKAKGGHTDGDERKNFPLHAGVALMKCLAHIGARTGKQGGHFEQLPAIGKQRVREYAGLFVQGLPDEMVEYLADAAEETLRARKKGDEPKPLALKAVVNACRGESHLARAREKKAQRLEHGTAPLAIGNGSDDSDTALLVKFHKPFSHPEHPGATLTVSGWDHETGDKYFTVRVIHPKQGERDLRFKNARDCEARLGISIYDPNSEPS